jgi:hypothetical protein
MSNYKYSQTWFIYSEIKQKLEVFCEKEKENNILEIGCFEGLSSVFFADNFIDNSKSKLTCVDPFLNIDDNDHKIFLNNNEELNFDFNISVCKNSDKIIIHKITSDSFFEKNNKTLELKLVKTLFGIDFLNYPIIPLSHVYGCSCKTIFSRI